MEYANLMTKLVTTRSTRATLTTVTAVCLILLALANPALADDGVQSVKVADPFLELRTGPGRGYPVFFVAQRGEWVEILKRKTRWFKVATGKGQSGWVQRKQMEKTLAPDGLAVKFKEPRYDDFTSRQWEAGVLTGEFDSAAVNALYVGYLLTKNLSAELSLSQILGDFSESRMVNIDLLNQPYPEWIVSPFFTLGTGLIMIKPRTSLVQASDRVEQSIHYGFGARFYVTERYFLRLEYKNYIIFTDRNENDEAEEFKLGLSVFF